MRFRKFKQGLVALVVILSCTAEAPIPSSTQALTQVLRDPRREVEVQVHPKDGKVDVFMKQLGLNPEEMSITLFDRSREKVTVGLAPADTSREPAHYSGNLDLRDAPWIGFVLRFHLKNGANKTISGGAR